MILCIDTATTNCSLGLCWDGDVLDSIDSDQAMQASEILHTMTRDLLTRNNISLAQLRAVAINGGPGSYTGLRIGAAAAKGFCYGLNIPLIHIRGLELMTEGIIHREGRTGFDYYIPMVDARRNEVFTAVYREDLTPVTEPGALILEPGSFDRFSDGKSIFFGSGAPKAAHLLTLRQQQTFTYFTNFAYDFKRLVWLKWSQEQFEDIINYTPDYLKKFHFTGAKAGRTAGS